jgi:protein-L-isoaspartate(D-aspartate) O-methyltransferase
MVHDAAGMDDFRAKRNRMVSGQIANRGIHSPAILRAMRVVPREHFVHPDMAEFAYEDAPLPIAEGQTISQPYIVAAMIEAAEVRSGDKVLEVGTGSGYAAAVLAEIANRVYAIERHESLTDSARDRLDALGYRNVELRTGDGTFGWPESSPFDAILVSAGGPDVPRSLKEQLVIGGRLLIPVGREFEQRLIKVTRIDEDTYTQEDIFAVAFVPLIGQQGWAEDS